MSSIKFKTPAIKCCALGIGIWYFVFRGFDCGVNGLNWLGGSVRAVRVVRWRRHCPAQQGSAVPDSSLSGRAHFPLSINDTLDSFSTKRKFRSSYFQDQERNVTQKKLPIQCVLFATPPQITLRHWLFVLGYVPFLMLRLVFKVSIFSSVSSFWSTIARDGSSRYHRSMALHFWNMSQNFSATFLQVVLFSFTPNHADRTRLPDASAKKAMHINVLSETTKWRGLFLTFDREQTFWLKMQHAVPVPVWARRRRRSRSVAAAASVVAGRGGGSEVTTARYILSVRTRKRSSNSVFCAFVFIWQFAGIFGPGICVCFSKCAYTWKKKILNGSRFVQSDIRAVKLLFYAKNCNEKRNKMKSTQFQNVLFTWDFWWSVTMDMVVWGH